MLAVFIAWLMLATLISWIGGISGWLSAIIAAVPFIIWFFKRPEDFG